MSFNSIINTADRLIKKYGVSCSIESLSDILNDEDDSVVAQTKEFYTSKMVLLPQEYIGRRYRVSKGDEQPSGLIKALMSAIIRSDKNEIVTYELSKKDSIVAQGKTYRIASIDPIMPSGQILVYQLELYV